MEGRRMREKARGKEQLTRERERDNIFIYIYIYINISIVSQGRPEGSLFNSNNTDVCGGDGALPFPGLLHLPLIYTL